MEEPTDADVTPGGTILFSCRVKYTNAINNEASKPALAWSKDGVNLEPSSRVQMLGGTLLIANARSSDVGEYRCHASSLVSRSARVRFYRGRAKPTIVHTPAQHTDVEKIA